MIKSEDWRKTIVSPQKLSRSKQRKGISKGLRKRHEKSNKNRKNKANMWSTENCRFCEKYIEEKRLEAGFSLLVNISTPYALKASFQIFGWDMRTRILLRKTSLSRSTTTIKKQITKWLSAFLWSKWRVSE